MNFLVYGSLIFVLSIFISLCREQVANGQIVSNSNQNSSNFNGFGSVESDTKSSKGTSAKEVKQEKIELPFRGAIKLEKPINNNGKDWDSRMKLKDLLKWGNQCNIDEIKDETSGWKSDSIDFYELDGGKFLIQIMCDNGMYNQGYYYYLYNEQKVLTAKLLDFEMIEFFSSREGKKHIIRNITNRPHSNPMFDEKTKLLRMYFKSTGYSGHEHTYKFVKGKPVLIERTETDCEEFSDEECKPKRQNLVKLRKKAKTFFNYDFDSNR